MSEPKTLERSVYQTREWPAEPSSDDRGDGAHQRALDQPSGSASALWAAARRAIGIRNGEQLT
jgi:hypothetical protein